MTCAAREAQNWRAGRLTTGSAVLESPLLRHAKARD
jgi:hypothetical protein